MLGAPGDQALCGSLATEWPGLLQALAVGSPAQVLSLPLTSKPPSPL